MTRTMWKKTSNSAQSEYQLTDRDLELQERLLKEAERYNATYGRLNYKKDGSLRDDAYDCPICKNKGYIHHVIFDDLFKSFYLEASRCDCWEHREKSKAMQEIEFASKFSFDNFETKEKWQEEMKEKAEDYVQNGAKRFLYLGGAIGSGKTHISFAVLRELIDKGLGVKVMYWSSDVTRLKSYNDEDYPSLIDSFTRPEVLYIEDFLRRTTAQGISEADKNIAFDIINGRYLAKKRTILSSEYLIHELLKIDSAVGSRVYEMAGDDYTVNIKREGRKNYRLKKKEKSFE